MTLTLMVSSSFAGPAASRPARWTVSVPGNAILSSNGIVISWANGLFVFSLLSYGIRCTVEGETVFYNENSRLTREWSHPLFRSAHLKLSRSSQKLWLCRKKFGDLTMWSYYRAACLSLRARSAVKCSAGTIATSWLRFAFVFQD